LQVAGNKVDAEAIKLFATEAHKAMMPKVPIIGWDVALTKEVS